MYNLLDKWAPSKHLSWKSHFHLLNWPISSLQSSSKNETIHNQANDIVLAGMHYLYEYMNAR